METPPLSARKYKIRDEELSTKGSAWVSEGEKPGIEDETSSTFSMTSASLRSEAIMRRRQQGKNRAVLSLGRRLREANMKKSLKGLDEDDRKQIISQSEEIRKLTTSSLNLQTLTSILPFEFKLPAVVMEEYQKSVQSYNIFMNRIVAMVAAIALTSILTARHISEIIDHGHFIFETPHIVRWSIQALFVCCMLTSLGVSFIPRLLSKPRHVHMWYIATMCIILTYLSISRVASQSKIETDFAILMVIQCNAFFRILPFWGISLFYLNIIGVYVTLDLIIGVKSHFEMLKSLSILTFNAIVSLVIWYMLSLQNRRAFLRRHSTELFNEDTENERMRNSQLLSNIFPQRIIDQVSQKMERMSHINANSMDDTISSTGSHSSSGLSLKLSGRIGSFPSLRRPKRKTQHLEKQLLTRTVQKDALEVLRQDMICESYDNVTIMFVTMVDFSRKSAFLAASHIINLLNEVFTEFDLLIESKGMYRVKTIGSSYMCVGGLTEESQQEKADCLYVCVDVALTMLEIVAERQFGTPMLDHPIEIAIGLNHGPIVAGVIGTKTLAYDIWSNSVNVAARMSTIAKPGTTFMTAEVYKMLRKLERTKEVLPYRLVEEEGRSIPVKGKGSMQIFALRPGAVDLDIETLHPRDSEPSISSSSSKHALRVPDFLKQYVPSRGNEKLRANRRIHDINNLSLADIMKQLINRDKENFFDAVWATGQMEAIRRAISLFKKRHQQTNRIMALRRTRNKVIDERTKKDELDDGLDDDIEAANTQTSLKKLIREVVDREHAGAKVIPEQYQLHQGKIRSFDIFHPFLVRLRDNAIHRKCLESDLESRWKTPARVILFLSWIFFMIQAIPDTLFLLGERENTPYNTDSDLWYWRLLWILLIRLVIGAIVLFAIFAVSLTPHFGRHIFVFNLTQFIFYMALLILTCSVQVTVPSNLSISIYGFIAQIMFMFSIQGWYFWIKVAITALIMISMVFMQILGSVSFSNDYVSMFAIAFMCAYSGYLSALEGQEDYFYRMLNHCKQEKLIAEQRRVRDLMNHVLPTAITKQLHTGEITMTNGVLAQHYELAGVLFADLVSFTRISSMMTPMELVTMLSAIYTAFDNIADKYRIEKIKLIGDCYHAASGIPIARKNHVLHLVLMGLEMIEYLESRNKSLKQGEIPIEFRVGISCGSVVGGVVGVTRFAFDLFGQLVDETNHIEQTGHPMRVHVSVQVIEHIQNVDQKLVEFHLRVDQIMNLRGTRSIPSYWVRRWGEAIHHVNADVNDGDK